VLYASRAAGLFHLARWLTRGKLRILCYHGFALGDETNFRPRLFIEPITLARRIRYLQRHRVPVVPLGDALGMLDRRALPPAATVITIDDGFFSTRQVLLSHFASAGMPATVYVTSYYADKQSPVFRLAAQYMFWKTRASRLDLNQLTPELAGAAALDDPAAADRALTAVTDYGERSLDEPGRTRCLRRLGQLLGVDYGELVSSRRLSLMTAEEIRSTAAAGFDIQLHTHRHRFPIDEEAATRELRDNRRWLENTLGTRVEHFCYPSGLWSPEHFAPLTAEGVQSAVTCDPGLNDASTQRLALRRFLDGENIAQIEFEAEVSGYLEILRKLRTSLARRRRP
jgi:peptidoglycan/xylan/chitin deacetylase (PgdA/CDA1 family)